MSSKAVSHHHEVAMGLAEDARVAGANKDETAKRDLSRSACSHEMTAAGLSTAEPTRSVLYRSAAWLAIDGGDFPLALELAAIGLRRVEHEEIRQELIEVAKAIVSKL